MQIVGPFWRQRPTASATAPQYGWCYFWMDKSGNIVAYEWAP